MSTDELWQNLTAAPLHQVTFFGRPYVAISHQQFDQVEHLFIPVYNITNKLQNFRSKRWRRHVHAIKYPKYVQVHIDHFNPNTFIFLTIPHLIFDVVPYFCSALFTKKKKSLKS